MGERMEAMKTSVVSLLAVVLFTGLVDYCRAGEIIAWGRVTSGAKSAMRRPAATLSILRQVGTTVLPSNLTVPLLHGEVTPGGRSAIPRAAPVLLISARDSATAWP